MANIRPTYPKASNFCLFYWVSPHHHRALGRVAQISERGVCDPQQREMHDFAPIFAGCVKRMAAFPSLFSFGNTPFSPVSASVELVDWAFASGPLINTAALARCKGGFPSIFSRFNGSH
jgi:hypothetical protein